MKNCQENLLNKKMSREIVEAGGVCGLLGKAGRGEGIGLVTWWFRRLVVLDGGVAWRWRKLLLACKWMKTVRFLVELLH